MKPTVAIGFLTLSILPLQNVTATDALSTMTPEELCRAQKVKALPKNAVDILSFGADPKGKRDSYDAFIKASQFLSNKNDSVHRVLVLPTGSYLLDRFADGTFKTFTKKISEAKKNNVVLPVEDTKLGNHIVFENASDFRIIGCDAVINVKGNFYRGSTDRIAVVSGEDYYYPERVSLTPFFFKKTKDFGVYGYSQKGKYGLELNGNVDKMSRDLSRRQLEATGIGIITSYARNYTFSNLDIHHFSVDGLTIGSGGHAVHKKIGDKTYTYALTDYNGTIQNVRSTNNGRQGMSVIAVRKLVVRDSIFSYTGRTGLNNKVNLQFPGFSPQSGVDVEPNHSTTPREYAKNKFILQDYLTQDIRFYDSRFENNVGIQFVAGTNNIYGLYLHNPIIESTYVGEKSTPENPNSSIYTVWLEGRVVRMNGGEIHTHSGAVMAAAKDFSDVGLQGVNITTSRSGLISVGKGRLVLLNSKITQKREKNQSLPPRYMPYIQNKNSNSLIGRNQFFYSKDFIDKTFQVGGLIQGICYSDPSKYKVWGNRFTTDYVGDSKVLISYTGSRVGVGPKTSGDLYQNVKVLMPELQNGTLQDGYFIKDQKECLTTSK